MLTKEQEDKIIDAANIYYNRGVTFGEAVVYALKAYDEMKDVEEVKATAKATNENNGSGAYVVFRPANKRGAEFWVFNSVEDMCKKLYQKYNSEKFQGDIAISRKTFDVLDFKHAQEVYLLKKENNHCIVTDSVGYCDCKTFKRG